MHWLVPMWLIFAALFIGARCSEPPGYDRICLAELDRGAGQLLLTQVPCPSAGP